MLWVPHVTWDEHWGDHWDDQIDISFSEMAKAKIYKNIVEIFVNWLKEKMTQEELDKKMITASMRGMGGLVKGLLAAGADKETRDESGSTGLNLAIKEGYSNVVEVFFDHGILGYDRGKCMRLSDQNSWNKQLLEAVKSGNNVAVLELIEKGADVDSKGHLQ